MTTYQFRSLMAVLWLIAANVADDLYVEVGCTLLFVAFSTGMLLAILQRAKEKARG